MICGWRLLLVVAVIIGVSNPRGMAVSSMKTNCSSRENPLLTASGRSLAHLVHPGVAFAIFSADAHSLFGSARPLGWGNDRIPLGKHSSARCQRADFVERFATIENAGRRGFARRFSRSIRCRSNRSRRSASCKNVLSGFFFVGSLYFWASFAEKSDRRSWVSCFCLRAFSAGREDNRLRPASAPALDFLVA